MTPVGSLETGVLDHGDCVDVLRRRVRDEPIDLVYLDPPFKSNPTDNILFEEHPADSTASHPGAAADTPLYADL